MRIVSSHFGYLTFWTVDRSLANTDCFTPVSKATLSHISSLLYLGHGRHKGAMLTLGLKDNYVGRQAQTLQGILNIRQPFKQGSVQHWDDLELLWKHVWQQELKRLRVSFNYR